jgi:hypothetical protein
MKSSLLLVVPALLALPCLASAQQPAPTQSGLDAGGLRPPEAIDSEQQPSPNAPEATTEQELARADQEDAGRGLEYVWLNAEIGGEHVGLQTFKKGDLVDGTLIKNAQTGLVYGGGLGLRILNYTAGVRFHMGQFSNWQLWTLDAEGQFRIPMGRLEPYFTLGAGYASVGGFDTDSAVASEASIHGFNVRLAAGLDYYVSNMFSVGANLSGDMLVLSRSAVRLPVPTPEPEGTAFYAEDGSGIGLGGTLTLVLGLHF